MVVLQISNLARGLRTDRSDVVCCFPLSVAVRSFAMREMLDQSVLVMWPFFFFPFMHRTVSARKFDTACPFDSMSLRMTGRVWGSMFSAVIPLKFFSMVDLSPLSLFMTSSNVDPFSIGRKPCLFMSVGINDAGSLSLRGFVLSFCSIAFLCPLFAWGGGLSWCCGYRSFLGLRSLF